MAQYLSWRLFLFVCGFFSAVRIMLVIFYMYGEWPDGVPYNSHHSYGRVRRLSLDNFLQNSRDKNGIREDIQEFQGVNITIVPEENIRQNANVLMNSERKKLSNGTPIDEFPLNTGDGCDEEILLLILVHSFPQHTRQRDAVRNTYGKNLTKVLGENVKVVFFCPGTSLTTAVADRMAEENLKTNDLVYCKVADSKWPSRPSSMAMLYELKWVKTYCLSAKFILLANDEQFVNVEGLVQRLKRQGDKDLDKFYLGQVKDGATVRPIRSPGHERYLPSAAFSGRQYPDFCIAKAGMVLSNAFIDSVYDTAAEFLSKAEAYPLGDIMLGIAAKGSKKKPMGDSEFHEIVGGAVYCELKDTLVLGGFRAPWLLRRVWANFTEYKQDSCPNPVPNATEIEDWTLGVDNRLYLEGVLQLIHNPVKLCLDENGNKRVFLLALVSTPPDHYELRDAIRRTWADSEYQARLKVRTLFVMARSTVETADDVERIRNEFEEHKDFVQAEFVESFHNLTLKVILGLRWARMYCPGASFVYKGDDDMLVNFEGITNYLRTLTPEESKELFIGHLLVKGPVMRMPSKYLTKRTQYPFKYFLPYFSGGGYIMAQQAVRKMYQKALSTRLIPIDDAYSGILAFRAGIRLESSGQLTPTGFRKDHCRLKEAFNLHGFAATTMVSTWKEFRNVNGTCVGV